jgi:hypothetical protein
VNLLAVTEQLVLLLTSLHRRTAILQNQSVQSIPNAPPECRATTTNGQTYLGDQHTVTLLDAHGQPVALLVERTGSDGEDLGLVELLNAGLGEEDAAGGLGLGLDALDEDAVQKRSEGADGTDGGSLLRRM